MKVKIGIHLMVWTANLKENLANYFEKAKVTGFEGVEIPIINLMEANLKTISRL